MESPGLISDPRRLCLLSLLLLLASSNHSARAASQIVRVWSFEQPAYGRPTADVTDHAFVWNDSLWHVYYTHRFTAEEPFRAIGHAISTNLRDWQEKPVVVLADSLAPSWRSNDVWAPHVTPWPGGGYVMALTGVNAHLSQQTGFLWSSDLENWVEDPSFPPVIPDSTLYWWSAIDENTHRDPHLVLVDSLWHLLYSARTSTGLAAIGHSSSPDLLSWQHHAPLLTIGDPWQLPDLESPGVISHQGQFVLFYTFVGTRTLRSASFDGPWDPDAAERIDLFASGGEFFSSGTGLLYSRNRLSSCDPTRHVLLCDTLDTSGWPYVRIPLTSLSRFEFKTGDAFNNQPTYGDPQSARGEAPSEHDGLYWLSSREFNPAPTFEYVCTLDRGASPRGEVESFAFVLQGDTVLASISGGSAGDSLRVSLHDDCTGAELVRFTPTGPSLVEQSAAVNAYRGQLVRWRIVDATSSPGGWIGADQLREIESAGLPPVSPLPQITWSVPLPGENFSAGAQEILQWSVTHPSGLDSLVLYSSYDQGKTLRRIAILGGNQTSFVWTVPDTLVFNALLRLVAYSTDGVWGCAESESFHINVTTGAPLPRSSGFLRSLVRNGRVHLEGNVPGGATGRAILEIFDVRGRRVATAWKGKGGERFLVPAPSVDADGRTLRSGIYFARLRYSGRSWQTRFHVVGN